MELVSLLHFPHNFWRKIFFLLCSINWPNFIVWLTLLCEILGKMCNAIVCKPGCNVMNFEVNLIFLTLFFLHDQKVLTKTLNILRTKRAFKMKSKAIFIIFKELSIRQITQIFSGRWETDFNSFLSSTYKFDTVYTLAYDSFKYAQVGLNCTLKRFMDNKHVLKNYSNSWKEASCLSSSIPWLNILTN